MARTCKPIGKKNTGGRPTKFKPEFYDLAYISCSQMGATDRQLASLFKVNIDTIENWKKEDDRFFGIIRQGKDEYNTIKVEMSLLRRAMGFEYDEITTEEVWVKNGNGNGNKRRHKMPGTKYKVVKKHIVPDVTAIIFWLVNRSRKDGRWQNIQNVIAKIIGEHTHKHLHEHDFDLGKLTIKELEKLGEYVSKAQKESDEAAAPKGYHNGVGAQKSPLLHKISLGPGRN